MKAMIFAAGLGTRLKPITDNIPKALAPLAGHTLLYHVIMRLKAAGADSFVVNVHHFPDAVISYIAAVPEFAGMDIRISDERDLLLETGGGIRHASALLGGDGPFLVHNVDIVSDLDINWFRSTADDGAMSTLLVSRRKTQRYLLFNDDMRLVGWTNVATGEVKTPFKGLDVEKCSKFAFGGVHLMSPGIFGAFDAVDARPEDFPLYDASGNVMPGSQNALGQRFPIMDFYLRAASAYEFRGVAPEGLTLIDAGKPESLAAAEAFVSGN
ncbi:MAG: NTP transferase domain-containing protein [Candidatus Cryptobacteroides sp.]|nr:NTP transferase domain-containing protein [Candidatus Cryptobacteroides sp.]